jgi:hypothetical protein
MGTFADWQPRYAEAGIATFPVRVDGSSKKPAVKGYLRVGQPGSKQLLLRFGGFDAFGFGLGSRSKITVLDVDSNDEKVLAGALARHGTPPIIVRSGSGNFQAWFKHGGEGRRIRPFPGKPVDILGGGYVVAPPSRGSVAPYTFIQGGLDDIERLPVMKAPPAAPTVPAAALVTDLAGDEVPHGIRNCSVWYACLQYAADGGDLDEMEAFAVRFNRNCVPQLELKELRFAVGSARKMTNEGRNWLKLGNGGVTINHRAVDELADANPYALALLSKLKRWHYAKTDFVLANAVAEKLGWTLPKFRLARDGLVKAGQIRCIHKGGGGPNDPPEYAWTDR